MTGPTCLQTSALVAGGDRSKGSRRKQVEVECVVE